MVEEPGEGIEGMVEGRRVIVGGLGFVTRKLDGAGAALRRPAQPGAAVAAVAIDGKLAGQFVLSDALRAETAAVLRAGEVASVGASRAWRCVAIIEVARRA